MGLKYPEGPLGLCQIVLTAFLYLIPAKVNASFNLFIGVDEVKTLLGKFESSSFEYY